MCILTNHIFITIHFSIECVGAGLTECIGVDSASKTTFEGAATFGPLSINHKGYRSTNTSKGMIDSERNDKTGGHSSNTFDGKSKSTIFTNDQSDE